MNSIKAFLKQKGLYLLCLALVFAATITGVAAIRSVVRGVGELTEAKQRALEEGTAWDTPDAAVNKEAQDVPVETPQPSSMPSASSSASGSSSSASQGSGANSGVTAPSAASSDSSAAASAAVSGGELTAPFSGDELVYNKTLGDWRTHNGADYAAEAGKTVMAVRSGTVTAVLEDAVWGGIVEITDAQDRVWRYCGLTDPQVTEKQSVRAGADLGTLSGVPAEAQEGTHLHLECLDAEGGYLDPETQSDS
ncbi:MAG: M23 family metallopeptidase [Gemmiger sp.]|uniref:M23 family metallopeptidase n=1 Tax=Gemmiger sp. TaxID=2049027 RepID=UPI002E79F123|nr:M23 family metallopeptidase [Gemmiger sp.]MEE0800065.1 M23 family metallopeptidase [Gemmiger sp.]